MGNKHIIVVGAGAFGGWTALHLLRSGANVTLLDSWGPGNSRASSGGDTRVIRGTYGPDLIYSQMAARALQLWKENEKRWQRQLYFRTGMLWMAGTDDAYEVTALDSLREAGLDAERWTTVQAAKRFPQFRLDDVNWVIYEKDSGYLLARRACESVLEAFLSEGGEYRQAEARPGEIAGGEMKGIKLSDETTLKADAYVFACGPWMGKAGNVFADVLGKLIQPTRQEVYYFGTPAGDTRFNQENFPVWIDKGKHIFYGIPGNQWRGFKIGDDTRGPAFDPTTGDRTPSADGIQSARAYMAKRFPALKDAPLLEARVCQYENSPDNHFILDMHPAAKNLWLLGGGSGHGFKHGPALGEIASAAVLGKKPPPKLFALGRFTAK